MLDPPGPGLLTVTWLLPALETSAAERDTVSVVVLKKVVGLADPFHVTTELDSKPLPLIVSVAALP